MRDNIKNTVLVLALVIAGISLPTSIMSIMNKPTTPITEVNNYYYNNTVIERFNDTIIVNNTIIEYYNTTTIVNNTIIEYYNTTTILNNTVIINNTIYEFPNSTIEFYHFEDVPDATTFFNKTYNITKDSILIIAMTVINYNYYPTVIIRKNNTPFSTFQDDDNFIIVVSNGSYNIEIFKNWVGLSDYDVDLFIGIF